MGDKDEWYTENLSWVLQKSGSVDIVDYMIEKFNHVHVLWDYLHSMMQHVDGLALVVAYDFYWKCAMEHLSLDAFGIDTLEIKPMNFQAFKVCASKHETKYSAKNCNYRGDRFM